ncbi:MFS transporter [Actinoplanes sp. NPDC049681]|uniref:MFS transporter n=1 Tax=Actinoplanes sp. NPDC049681 TaxID=3363905 RepID=UPI0037876346
MRALHPGLGPDFIKLWSATAIANLGDGVALVAGPLLIASLTPDPAAVAGAAFAQQVPWLLFALISGAWADRLDRRRLVVTVDLIRAAALGLLVVCVICSAVSIWLVYGVVFVLGTCETLADTASSAFVPALVPAERLPVANAWLGATFTVINQFAAKPLGGWLFVVAAAAPFGLQAAAFVVAAGLIHLLPAASPSPSPAPPASSPAASPPPASCDSTSPSSASESPASLPPASSSSASGSVGLRDRQSLRSEIVEGVRWLWAHRLLRTLAVAMACGNLVYCAAFATFVLYARDRLGLGSVGYGTLLTAFAVGGLLGSVLAPRLIRTVGAAVLLRAGLLVEVALHATLAATTTPVVAAVMIVVFGVHTMVWGTVAWTLRQRAVPSSLYGRVTGAYSLLDLGGAALGSLAGGALAQTFGLIPVFWGAAVAMGVVVVLTWRPLGRATVELREADPS